jgi:type II restriction/modification system DNA methylase subunit YeeA
MRRNGFDVARKPILWPFDTIECRDAVLNPDGTEAAWSEAEFVVGNPPFLGGKLMRSGLGDDDVETLFHRYRGRVPPEADLVTYWFEKARA